MVCSLYRAKSLDLVTKMGPGNKESLSNLDRKMMPVPPPLPVHLNTRFYQRGLSTSGSKNRGHFCSSNSINDPMDRLFDEAYRADVSILTDDGGVIYAHASILVSLFSHVFCHGTQQRYNPSFDYRKRVICKE